MAAIFFVFVICFEFVLPVYINGKHLRAKISSRQILSATVSQTENASRFFCCTELWAGIRSLCTNFPWRLFMLPILSRNGGVVFFCDRKAPLSLQCNTRNSIHRLFLREGSLSFPHVFFLFGEKLVRKRRMETSAAISKYLFYGAYTYCTTILFRQNTCAL